MPILTAKEVIEHLKDYDDNEELLITWWDSKFIDNRFECGEHLDDVMGAGERFLEHQAIGYVNDVMEESLEYLKARDGRS